MSSVEVTRQPSKYVTVTKTRNVSTVTAPAEQTLEVHDPGIAGPPNTLAVGTVTTGNSPEVTISGSAPSQTINFVIPVGGTYVHNQMTPSNVWTITHSLGFYPSVSVIDYGGNTVVGDVSYISENQISISFSASFGGKAYLS